MKRIYSIDFTRGIVMMIMALDHVRDMIHVNSITHSPTDLSSTTPMVFFTRWITYLCAPIFVFLAGASSYLSLKNKSDLSQSRKFLFKRGLWLVLLEFTIVNLGLFFDVGFHTLLFEVIATIGIGFIVLSFLIIMPSKTIGITGLLIIFLHDLIFLLPNGPSTITRTIINQLFLPSALPLFSGHVFIMGYPPVPWLGIMLTGFGAGRLFELPQARRTGLFLKISAGALLLFVFLRFINLYGDPIRWSVQKNDVYTLLSFFNIAKYPPSLLFCAVTLGVMFLILAIGEQIRNKTAGIVQVYGKVPLFYFVIHFYFIHILLIVILYLQGFKWADMNFVSGTFGRPKGTGGLPLWAVYIIWIAVVTLLYKPCQWFGRYKSQHSYWWLKYI